MGGGIEQELERILKESSVAFIAAFNNNQGTLFTINGATILKPYDCGIKSWRHTSYNTEENYLELTIQKKIDWAFLCYRPEPQKEYLFLTPTTTSYQDLNGKQYSPTVINLTNGLKESWFNRGIFYRTDFSYQGVVWIASGRPSYQMQCYIKFAE